MKNLKITLSLFFAVLGLHTAFAQGPLEYCNNRFGFCVEYPGELHLAQDRPINGDGILLEAEDGDIQVVIAGSHNVMDWAPEKIYSFEKEAFQESHQGIAKELKYEADASGFQAILSAGADMEAIRMWGRNGVYVLISITGPQAKTKHIEALWNKINVKFNS
ncbi:MAG: hypothetical protein RIC19_02345 [Phaeodactylibacter sp.]|uniref:hypothetical protein n=1 Tax=Phaeodactylibacter sp. TaxID=1940289 RepID=UPI0032ECFE89